MFFHLPEISDEFLGLCCVQTQIIVCTPQQQLLHFFPIGSLIIFLYKSHLCSVCKFDDGVVSHSAAVYLEGIEQGTLQIVMQGVCNDKCRCVRYYSNALSVPSQEVFEL